MICWTNVSIRAWINYNWRKGVMNKYRQTSYVRYTKPQMFLISSCSCLCPDSLKSGREQRCSGSSADRWCSNCIWVINNLLPTKVCLIYIRGLRVTTSHIKHLSMWARVNLWKVIINACPTFSGRIMVWMHVTRSQWWIHYHTEIQLFINFGSYYRFLAWLWLIK